MKTIFLLSYLFTTQIFAWTLFSQETNRPQEIHCPQRVEVIESFDHSLIQVISIQDQKNAGWQITNVNTGTICEKANFNSVLSSFECSESKYAHRTYSYSWCESKSAGVKCSPFSKKDVVTSIALRGSTMIITDDNNSWYNGALLLKCVYSID